MVSNTDNSSCCPGMFYHIAETFLNHTIDIHLRFFGKIAINTVYLFVELDPTAVSRITYQMLNSL
jgi:hypothetical protein